MSIGKLVKPFGAVPPSGGSLEIGNGKVIVEKPLVIRNIVPPSGGSLEIGNLMTSTGVLMSQSGLRSPFGGIPRNWKHEPTGISPGYFPVPPSGGSLEIGNTDRV